MTKDSTVYYRNFRCRFFDVCRHVADNVTVERNIFSYGTMLV